MLIHFSSPDPGVRDQDLRPGRNDRLPEHRDGEPLHERHNEEQAVCRQTLQVRSIERWESEMSSSLLLYQDPVSKGLPGIMCERQNVHIMDVEHQDTQVSHDIHFDFLSPAKSFYVTSHSLTP